MVTDHRSPFCMQIARELQVALVLDWGWLEGFRQAFDPAQIRWDVDHTQFYRFAGDVEQGGDCFGATSVIACHRHGNVPLPLSTFRHRYPSVRLEMSCLQDVVVLCARWCQKIECPAYLKINEPGTRRKYVNVKHIRPICAKYVSLLNIFCEFRTVFANAGRYLLVHSNLPKRSHISSGSTRLFQIFVGA